VFAAFGIQDAMRMRQMSPVACQAVQHFFTPHYLINGTIFENKLLNIKYMLI
jgi:hypothetical protein